MVLKVAKRGMIPSFVVMDVLQAANKRQSDCGDVLHLELGQPASPAPQNVIEAARSKLLTNPIAYTEAFGLPTLREEISKWYKLRYNVDVSKNRIVVTTGSSAGFLLAFLSSFDIHDRVAMAEPGYPGYRNILLSLGIVPVGLPVSSKTRHQLTSKMLNNLTKPLAGLIVASPSNPTGSMISDLVFSDIANTCRTKGVRLISDEIYHGITYGNSAQTALKFDDQAIVISSFSKYFSMTGWRIGWMVVPDELIRSVECLAQNIYISAPTLSQWGAIMAFNSCEELDLNVKRYSENRSLLLEGLSHIGFDQIATVDGAFYLYVDVSKYTDDSFKFCKTLLNETGVAITPGIDFDTRRGEQTVRLSFSGATSDIEDAISRMANWMSRYH
ncbi:MAG: 1-aminocyclopropane-1-carboxylate deaminase [Rhodospirillaceae bacterium]|nr:1-aminocyclopropane-1-carboxylate deaminase [Rhodospirillaceae bacterium]